VARSTSSTGADRSSGIEVGRVAGVPYAVIARARVVLTLMAGELMVEQLGRGGWGVGRGATRHTPRPTPHGHDVQLALFGAPLPHPVVERLNKLLKRPIFIINDADAAGIAEMRFGVSKGRSGKVIFLTLGTGVGSGVFMDGILVPNTEFGQMEIRGRAAERRSAAIARVKRGLSWKAWAADLDEHLDRIQQLMFPNLMILGGGVSKSADRFIPRLTVKCEVVAAELRNDAGIIGAAVVAAESRVEDAEGVSITLEPAQKTREAKT
jgi:hypothetical protein